MGHYDEFRRGDQDGTPQPAPCPAAVPPLHKGTPYVNRPGTSAPCGNTNVPHDDVCRRPAGHDGVHSGKWTSWPQAPDAAQVAAPATSVMGATPEQARRMATGWTHEDAARNSAPVPQHPEDKAIFNALNAPNPKTLVGSTKVPMFSVVPATALIRMARAMQYGAFLAPRKDTEQKGYGAFNWRDQDIEYMTYIDAAWRHLAAAADGEDVDPDTGDLLIGHLEEAMASIAILIDAMAHGTYINNRPTKSRGLVGQALREYREK